MAQRIGFFSVALVAAMLLLPGGGCSSHGKASIAEGAKLVKSGTGGIEYTAKTVGTVYVLDADQNRLIAVAGMHPAQTARIDTANGEVRIDSKVITSHPVSDTKHYQIYFRPDNNRGDR